jgi:glutaredoxin
VRLFKQQCPLILLFLGAVGYLILLANAALDGAYVFALAWLLLVPLGWWGYIRVFPSIARYLGYGSVEDQPAGALIQARAKVTIYTALGCVFCPIVKQRIRALQPEMGFDLEIVDVTLKPDLVLAKGIFAVPVVEVGAQRLVGNVTSAQLAALIRDEAATRSTGHGSTPQPVAGRQ